MFSKLTIDTDFDDKAIIKVKHGYSDDLRDKTVGRFLRPNGNQIPYLKLEHIGEGGSTGPCSSFSDYEIHRIKTKEMPLEALKMLNELCHIFVMAKVPISFNDYDVPDNAKSSPAIGNGFLCGIEFEEPEEDGKYPQGHYFPMTVNVKCWGDSKKTEYLIKKVKFIDILSVGEIEYRMPYATVNGI